VLRSHNVTSLALGGIATSGVVLSTARDAADRDFAVTILEDLCLNFDDEVQRVLMEKVFPAQATVIVSADWHPEVSATV
jgi:nicotinamidase-related amidase